MIYLVCAHLIYIIILFSENGEMCAMKEVTLFSDDAKSKESAKQLMQVVALVDLRFILHYLFIPFSDEFS